MLPATVLGVALLGACGAGGAGGAGGAADTPGPEVGTTVQQPAATSSTEDDVAACTAFGDVLTILANADVALSEGRMAAQEQDGWYRLATRVLDRLPSGGDTAVQTAIGALQEAAPAAPAPAFGEPTGVRSPAWSQAEVDLGTACEAVGSPLAINMFTGG